MGDAVEEVARGLHRANIEVLRTRGIETVEFPFDGDHEVEVVRPWEDLDESVRTFYTDVASHLIADGAALGGG